MSRPISRPINDLGALPRGRHPVDPTGEVFGDTHWPRPLPHEKGNNMKYVLIDVTTVEGTKVLLVGTLRQVELHGKICKIKGLEVIAPPLEGRGFSKLEKLPLQYLYWSVCQETPPDDYATLVKQCVEKLETFPVDPTPLRELEQELAKLVPPEEAPVERPEPVATVRPAATNTTGQVWEIADLIYEKRGKVIDKETRTQIIEQCVANGINTSTAATQYAKWKGSK